MTRRCAASASVAMRLTMMPGATWYIDGALRSPRVQCGAEMAPLGAGSGWGAARSASGEERGELFFDDAIRASRDDLLRHLRVLRALDLLGLDPDRAALGDRVRIRRGCHHVRLSVERVGSGRRVLRVEELRHHGEAAGAERVVDELLDLGIGDRRALTDCAIEAARDDQLAHLFALFEARDLRVSFA